MSYPTWLPPIPTFEPEKKNKWIKWLLLALAIIMACLIIWWFFIREKAVILPPQPNKYKQVLEDSIAKQDKRIQQLLTQHKLDHAFIDSLISNYDSTEITDSQALDALGVVDSINPDSSDQLFAIWLLQADSIKRGFADYSTLHPFLFER